MTAHAVFPLITAALSSSRVAVTVTQFLDIPAVHARAAFLDFTWRRGGGVPALITTAGDVRTLWPLKMQEALLPARDASSVCYTVVDMGPILRDQFLPNTHHAEVGFTDIEDGCNLVWEVHYDVVAHAAFWEHFTRAAVGAAAAALASHVAAPLRYTRHGCLDAPSVDVALEAWLTFVFDQGRHSPATASRPVPALTLAMFDRGRRGAASSTAATTRTR
jgi:hypothetical protein